MVICWIGWIIIRATCQLAIYQPSNLLEGQTLYSAEPNNLSLYPPSSKRRPETVWSTVSGWVLHKKAERREHLKELAAQIHWPLMEADFRSQQVIKSSKWVFSNFQVVKSSLYQHLDVDWSAEMLLLFGGDHRDSRQVGANIIQHSQFLAEMHNLFFLFFICKICIHWVLSSIRFSPSPQFTEISRQKHSQRDPFPLCECAPGARLQLQPRPVEAALGEVTWSGSSTWQHWSSGEQRSIL